MRDRLPPLFSLQTFEAAARLGNFTRAAAELHLTPGAVSRQIRQLEDWCGLTLFERKGPQVSLTRDGDALLARLGGPLAALHAAVFPPPTAQRLPLVVATLASIARAWLLPRLADFRARHPQIDLQIQTDYALARPAPRMPMVAIRHGQRPGGELVSELLFEDRLIALASPDLAARLGPDPRRWPAALWMRNVTSDTAPWLAAAGMADDFEQRGLSFNDADLLLDAAEQGLGLALGRLSLAWPRLEAGTLVALNGIRCRSPRDNLLVLREDSAELPAVRAFVEWVRAQAAVWREALERFDAEGPVHPC